jgi:hypothetical protein
LPDMKWRSSGNRRFSTTPSPQGFHVLSRGFSRSAPNQFSLLPTSSGKIARIWQACQTPYSFSRR